MQLITIKDDTLLQLRNWDDDRLVILATATNVGVAAGNNQGIRAAIEAGCEHVSVVEQRCCVRSRTAGSTDGWPGSLQLRDVGPPDVLSRSPDVIWWAGDTFNRSSVTGLCTMRIAQKDTGGSATRAVIMRLPVAY